MERTLKLAGHNTLKIMHTLPVYSQERLDLIDKLERSGYGLVREPNDNTVMDDLLAGFTVAVVLLALAGMVLYFSF